MEPSEGQLQYLQTYLAAHVTSDRTAAEPPSPSHVGATNHRLLSGRQRHGVPLDLAQTNRITLTPFRSRLSPPGIGDRTSPLDRSLRGDRSPIRAIQVSHAHQDDLTPLDRRLRGDRSPMTVPQFSHAGLAEQAQPPAAQGVAPNNGSQGTPQDIVNSPTARSNPESSGGNRFQTGTDVPPPGWRFSGGYV